MNPPPRRALIVTFDHFPASILGSYGNEWVETPHLDRLAANGLVGDACFTSCVDSWSMAEVFADNQSTCPRRGLLIREASSSLDFSAAGFQTIETLDGERGSAAKPDRIPLAEMVRRAQELWQTRQHDLIWLHARGVSIPSDPPAGFAELYLDEFEDRGLEFAQLAEAARAVHPLVTAGWVSLLDHWVGELLTDVPHAETLILITAARGAVWQPWPNSFGPFDQLRSQAVQVPWILSAGNATPRAPRISLPLTTRLLDGTLKAWFQGENPAPDATEKPVMTRGVDACRVTSRDWSAIFPGSSGHEPLLFARPEDFWEVNNQATISPGVIDDFQPWLAANQKPGS